MRHYHRVYASIDLDKLEANYKAVKAAIGGKKICAVIKADGYGHGAVPLARELEGLGADMFAVAAAHEAVMLRRYGIEKPILVLGYTAFDNYEDLIKYDITQTVFKESMARELSEAALRMEKPAKVHLKIDTGMGRIGFEPGLGTVEKILEVARLPFLEIEGIFTHFARADEKDQSFTHMQVDRFNVLLEALKEKGLAFDMVHAANSAGTMEMPRAHYDMARVGIALLGLYPSDEVNRDSLQIEPILSLHSNIILLKEVPPGTPISYGGTYVTEGRRKVATVPVGYGDGYSRALSSKGRVLVRGQYAPIIGRVCMDQFMVDVTDVAGAADGDEVILIGSDGGSSIPVEELAAHMQTINYEVVCLLSKRIPRVYTKGGEPVYSIDYF